MECNRIVAGNGPRVVRKKKETETGGIKRASYRPPAKLIPDARIARLVSRKL